MSETHPAPRRLEPSLTLKLGRMFEAHATGWAVLTVPVLVALVLAAPMIARVWL